ncbi:MAG: glycosyltransferase family A protein [Blastocatellia bacterium]
MKEDLNPVPRVSVVICAYNAEPYVAATLDSVFAQTYRNFEVVLVNDGATDNTEEVIRPFLDKIVYVKQANKGPGAARNAALRVARGRYIAILDSDDQWLPEYLEQMVGFLDTHPEVDLYYPNAVFFGGSHFDDTTFQEVCPSSEPITVEKVLQRECNVFISALFRREMLKKVGWFDEALRGSEDLDLWLRMLQRGYHFAFTPQVLVRYRKRGDSLSASSVGYYEQVLKAVRKFRASSLATSLQKSLAETQIKQIVIERDLLRSKQEIAARDFVPALKHLVNVLSARPSIKLKLVTVGVILFPALVSWFMTRRST